MAWWQILLIIFGIIWLIGVLISVFVKPLREVYKVFFYFIKTLIQCSWVLLLWWWIALVCVCLKRNPPPVMLFQGGQAKGSK